MNNTNKSYSNFNNFDKIIAGVLLLTLIVITTSCKRDLLFFGHKYNRNEPISEIVLRKWTETQKREPEWYNSYFNKESITFENNCFKNIYRFKENEKVASIGASKGVREVIFSFESPKISFYLEDISHYWLSLFPCVISKLEEVYGEKTKSEFTSIQGGKKKTRLKDDFFDKILIENSIHEFDYPNEMLEDIVKKMAQGGELFISENIAQIPNQKGEGCNKQLYSEKEIIDLLQKVDYTLVEKYQPYAYDKNFLVFKFRKISKNNENKHDFN